MQTDRSFAELLQALGFQPVGVVHKRRRAFHDRCRQATTSKAHSMKWTASARSSNWNYMADDSGLDAARRVISTLATELDLGPSERAAISK